MKRIALLLLLILAFASCSKGGKEPVSNPAEPSDVPLGTGSMGVHLESDAAADEGWLARTQLSVLMPKVGLRRIAPGIIPDSVWFEDSDSLGNGSWMIRGLPLNSHVLLQLIIGGSVQNSASPTAADDSAMYLHLPVFTGEQGQIDYTIELSVTQSAGQITAVTALVCDKAAGGQEYSVRLDPGSSTLVRDNDGDGDFSDETPLPDPDRLGISRSLLARLEAANSSAAGVQSAQFVGTLESADLAGGQLSLASLRRLGSSEPALPGSSLVRFAEDSSFILRTVSVFEEKRGSAVPAELSGRQVTFHASRFENGGELWLDSLDALDLDLPPDSIAAVPARSDARPGEPVPVTVYTNRTAMPLYELDKLRISFNSSNRFRPGSLDPGERGGGAELADGAWAELGQSAFELPAEDRLTSSPLDEKRDFVEISLIPLQRRELVEATGALCNFELICHSNAALAIEAGSAADPASFYSSLDGAERAWGSYIAADNVQVQVSGRPLDLEFAIASANGEGETDWRPRLARPGESMAFQLSDPRAGDVTAAADTKFTAVGNGGVNLELPGGRLDIPADFRGMLRISASHAGVFCRPASEKWIFVDDFTGFSFDLHEKESYIFGGSASGWAANCEAESDSFSMRIRAINAGELHACYFTLHYDHTLYTPAGYSILDPLQAEGSLLLLPEHSLHARAKEGVIEFGFCQLNPQLNPGMNGALDVMDIHFIRNKVGPLPGYGEAQHGPPADPAALLALTEDGGGISFSPYIAGDYNQDGEVSITTRDRLEICDLTAMAISFGQGYSAADEPAAVVDMLWDGPLSGFSGDGVVDITSITPLMRYQGSIVQEWRLCYGASPGQYPDEGQLLQSFRHSDYQGSANEGRISYEWRPGGSLPAGDYWVLPVGLGQTGAASPVLSIE